MVCPAVSPTKMAAKNIRQVWLLAVVDKCVGGS